MKTVSATTQKGGVIVTDYISRDAAINLARDLLQIKKIEGYEQYNQAVLDYCNELLNLPAADVRPVVQGKWKVRRLPDDWVGTLYRCDQCGNVEESPSCFCPQCGLPMEVEE